MSRLTVLFVLAACSDSGVTQHNDEPTAALSSHREGDTVREGYGVTLRGVVGDGDDAVDTLGVAWLVDGVEVCDGTLPDVTGGVLCEHIFTPGPGRVVLEVTDPHGGRGTGEVTLSIQPTDAPSAAIITPTADGRYYTDQLLPFTGTIGDAEDPVDLLLVSWETEALGDLGVGVSVGADGTVEGYGRLDEGEHVLRLVVVDTTGKEAVDSMVVTVGPANSAPSCSITSPIDGGAGAQGGEVRFEGLVGDADIPVDQLDVRWTSNLDGELDRSTPDSSGRVRFAWNDLTLGTHLVTLTATDDTATPCTTSVYFTVGTAPSLTLESPIDGSTVNEGDAIEFSATVSDTEDAPTAVALSWVSDLDGALSTAGADSSGVVGFRSSSLSTGDHLISVTATDTDGLYTIRSLSLTVNALPTAPTVVLDPDPAGTQDALTAVASGSTDPDGSGTVSYTYAWSVDAVASTASTSAILPAGATTKHELWRVVVTPNDGTGDGAAGEASLTVGNTGPTLSGPTLSPSGPHFGDTVTCAATATDVDGDIVNLSTSWSDGSTGSSYVVSAADVTGDVLGCTVTADDGDGGMVSASASDTITNTPPTVTVSLSPTTPRTDDTLSATATTADADGDAVSVTYDWYVDGVLMQSGTLSTLDGSVWFDKDQTVVVQASANDGVASTGAVSTSLTVENTPPGAPSVSVTPSGATAGDDLDCGVDVVSTDADGDAVTYTMSWTVDGVDYTAATTTTWPADTVDGADVGDTEAWVCTATPNDGDDDGDTAIASVTTASSAYTGSIEMSATDTVDGYAHGEWAALNSGGRVASRIVLTAGCDSPMLAFYQHSSADSSINGSFYVMDSVGTVLAYSTYATYGSCNDCWLGHASALSVTMSAATTYYLGFQNSTGFGDMSGPSIYLDSTARTVGIATFDDPRADKPGYDVRGLPTTTVGWQQRWKVACN